VAHLLRRKNLVLDERSGGHGRISFLFLPTTCARVFKRERPPRSRALVRLLSTRHLFLVMGTRGSSAAGSAARARCLCAFIVTLAGAHGRNTLVSEEKGAAVLGSASSGCSTVVCGRARLKIDSLPPLFEALCLASGDQFREPQFFPPLWSFVYDLGLPVST